MSGSHRRRCIAGQAATTRASSISGASWDAFLVAPAFEGALDAELGTPPAGARAPRWPGLLTRPAGDPLRDPVFARQLMPAARWVRGASLEELCDGALAEFQSVNNGGETPFALHVFVPNAEQYRTIAPQAAALERKLEQTLRRRQQNMVRGLVSGDAAALLQVALVGRTSALVSWTRSSSGRPQLSRWPAGIPDVPEDRQAPSRAYKKLREALAMMGMSPGPGDTVIDLGASPGGWSHVALRAGAEVVGIDRAPCLPPVAGHPRFTTLKGDALAYHPATPVDWMLCDVICDPRRTLALIDRWVKERLCRHLVATVKFKGDTDYGLVQGWAARLAHAGFSRARVKHLHHNQNEVCVMASIRP
jgi:23S rRNA (cytidine2498-2'-O)-methyltransferase